MTRPVSLIQANIRAVRGQLGELRPQLKGVQTRLANRWSGFKRTLVSGLPTAITGGLGVATLYKLEVSSPGVLESIQAAGKSVLLYDDIVPALLGAGPGAGIGILLAFTISKVLTVFAQKKEARLADEMGRLEIEQRSLEIELKEAEEEAARSLAGLSNQGRTTLPPRSKEDQLPLLQYIHAPMGFNQIAGFKVIRSIGDGGTSDVVLAETDEFGAKKLVVIKLIKFSKMVESQLAADEEEASARAYSEIMNTRVLNGHPNIVNLIDYGMIYDNTEEKIVALIFDYISGQALDLYVQNPNNTDNNIVRDGDRCFMKIDAAVEITKQVFNALYHAHFEAKDSKDRPLGMVHRDIKPPNIIVSRTPSGDYSVKVLDFGLAMTPNTSKYTRASVVLGTTTHMSPEQARKGELTFSSDLYSVAVTFYETITGERAFKRGTNPDGTVKDVERWYEVPDIKKAKHLEALYSAEKILACDRFFQKALAEHVEMRHSSPQEFIKELNNILKMKSSGGKKK
ncbi:MAG: serine/threonine-protein kinase [Candidatus Margulisiibacteriota bacterium]|nr:serine/threonine protein kinase [Candidatus Margulisiibacteriota bacterium]